MIDYSSYCKYSGCTQVIQLRIVKGPVKRMIIFNIFYAGFKSQPIQRHEHQSSMSIVLSTDLIQNCLY